MDGSWGRDQWLRRDSEEWASFPEENVMAHDDKRRPAGPASKPGLKAGDGKPGRPPKVSAERPFDMWLQKQLSCLHQTESDMLASEDKKKALTNPSSVFKNPADVIACKDLDNSEKAAILKQWEVDARLLQVATEEGMTEGERSLFADVKKAQEKLHLPDLEEDGAPTKAGP